MRDYINKLSRGQYTYRLPKISAPDGSIDTTVVTGEVASYQLTLTSDEKVKDVIYSSNPRVKLSQNGFAGEKQVVEYTVDARGEEPGSIIEGKFSVVSNAGEMEVPFVFHVVEQYFDTSLGKAYNLFHFTNLVHTEPEEAAKIFLSQRFSKVFIGNDEHLKNVYESVSHQENVYAAMEEFLLVLRKKTQVSLKIDDSKRVFKDFRDNLKENISIHTSTWGYVELQVSSDAPFIIPSSEKIGWNEFIGGKYELEYLLDKEKMHAGINYGKIYISSFYQSFVIEIEVYNTSYKPEIIDKELFPDDAREIKQAKEGLTKEYLAYRMKRQDMQSWILKSNQILNRIRGIVSNNLFFDVVQAQMYIMEKREDDGRWILEHVHDKIFNNEKKDVELYCYYIYVKSLLEHSTEYIKKAIEIVTGYYENGYDSWKLLWILFYLKGGRDTNLSLKLLRIKEAFRGGCTSPVMYFEACAILNQQPQLLRVLNKFEMKILTFGCRYNIIQEKLAIQISEVVGNEKVAGSEAVRLLKQLYQVYEDDRLLSAIVTQMIRNAYIGEDSFSYYEKGVLRGLRITRLYEYYLASVKKDYDKRIPKVVLMYFQYDNELEYGLKAYLYANILKNKAAYGEIYNSYEKNIEIFVYEQLKEGHIDDSLIILYKALWKPQLIDKDTYEFMAKLLFMHKFTCFDDGIQAVCVKHKEQNKPKVYPLTNGQVYVPMYTDGCCVLFVCQDGIRRKDSVNYEVEKVFENMPLKEELLSMDFLNDGIKLYNARSYANRGDYTTEAVLDWFDMLDNNLMNKEFHEIVNSWIIHYYFEYHTGDDFRGMFGQIIKEDLNSKAAKELIEASITFEMYQEAFALIDMYGYEMVLPQKLFRLVKYMIGICGSEYNSLLIEVGSFIFDNRLYDEEVLEYMMEFYNSTNDNMYHMWKAVVNFSMNAEKLSERVLAQFLFTGEHTGRMTEVFSRYYGGGARGKIVKAYISYNAYLYLVHNKKANDIVFRAIEDAFTDNEELVDTCYIAWLKHMTHVLPEQFTDKRKEQAQKILNILCRSDKLYSFYNKFNGILDVPYNVVDKTVIEYVANPDSKVEIHYTFDSDENAKYTTQIMTVSAGGIFTKAFTLLYGDKLTYYFTVTGAGEDLRTEKFSCEYGELNPEQSESRFDYINDCLASRELHDMVTMKKMMRSYCVKNYVTKQIFKPMKG